MASWQAHWERGLCPPDAEDLADSIALHAGAPSYVETEGVFGWCEWWYWEREGHIIELIHDDDGDTTMTAKQGFGAVMTAQDVTLAEADRLGRGLAAGRPAKLHRKRSRRRSQARKKLRGWR